MQSASDVNEIMSPMSSIYTPDGFAAGYTTLLKVMHNINGLLRKNGYGQAPDDDSLRNTRLFYELVLDKPLDEIPTIHVGGSNGKGTCCHKLAEWSRMSGARTGLFVSPHISSFRERFVVDGEPMSEAEFQELLPPLLRECVSRDVPLTQFELAFLLGAAFFAFRRCEVVVLEVGLGGDTDATNVVRPVLSMVTSVSLEHTRILGSTVELIARRKAGIFKTGVPAVVGPGCPQSTMAECATAANAALMPLALSADVSSVLGLQEKVDEEQDGWSTVQGVEGTNIALCVTAMLCLRDAGVAPFCKPSMWEYGVVKEGLCSRPPCRWEVHSYGASLGGPVPVVLDVAHNPSAIEELMRKVKRELCDCGYAVHVVLGMARDKDVEDCLRHILAVVSAERIHFAKSTNWRAASYAQFFAAFSKLASCDSREQDAEEPLSAQAAIEAVLRRVVGGERAAVVVCGTVNVMLSAWRALGIHVPSDETDLAR
jgi:dihydrofolate synthase / folylpolyglutamate synthase